MADDLSSGIGSALGGLFGGLSGLASTNAGVSAVGTLTDTGAAQLAPYTYTGASYIEPTAKDLVGDTTGSKNIGQDRINADTNPVDFEDFAKNYNTSEGAQYLMDTAKTAQDDTAAAKGGLLSGANVREQTKIAEGIANQDLLDQYKAYASGQEQDFQQRETSYKNLYGQEQLGETAATGEAGTYAQGARAVGSLYQGLTSSATSSGNAFGSALGTIFSSIAALF